jgi:hypothetical protein
MFDLTDTYSFIDKSVCTYQNVSSNLRTGEGRARCRPLSRHKTGDLKKKTHRKMAKKSRRANRK